MESNYKLCFIIAHKYFRGYSSFIDYYIDNIQQFYKDSLILLVDNNSTYFIDITERLKKYENNNLVFLINNTECKYELGACKVGMNYLISNNLLNKYDYYVCTQDSFVLTNKYDFNNLSINNIFACPIMTLTDDTSNRFFDSYFNPLVRSILKKTNLEEKINELRICWGNSFVINNSKVEEFLEITHDIIILNKNHACDTERFLSAIMYKLNNYKNYSIDIIYGENEVNYLWNVDIPSFKTTRCFTKKLTNKNDLTIDL